MFRQFYELTIFYKTTFDIKKNLAISSSSIEIIFEKLITLNK